MSYTNNHEHHMVSQWNIAAAAYAAVKIANRTRKNERIGTMPDTLAYLSMADTGMLAITSMSAGALFSVRLGMRGDIAPCAVIAHDLHDVLQTMYPERTSLYLEDNRLVLAGSNMRFRLVAWDEHNGMGAVNLAQPLEQAAVIDGPAWKAFVTSVKDAGENAFFIADGRASAESVAGTKISNFDLSALEAITAYQRVTSKDTAILIGADSEHVSFTIGTATLVLGAKISDKAGSHAEAADAHLPAYVLPAQLVGKLKLSDALELSDAGLTLNGVTMQIEHAGAPESITLSGKETIRAIKAARRGKKPVRISLWHGVVFIAGQPVTATPASFERYEAFRSAVREDMPRISMKYGGTLYTGDQQTGVVLVGRFQAIRWQLLETIGGIHFYALSRVWRGADGRSYEAPAVVIASAIIITEIIREACSAAGGDMIYGLAKYTWRFGGQLTGLFIGLRAITLTDYRAWQAAQTDAVPMREAA